MMFDSSKAICIQFPALVKASISKAGRRIVEFECGNEEEGKDIEGDLILQEALLKSSKSFLSNGVIDRDHFSELGRLPEYAWLGIKDPDEWVIGKAFEVKDIGGGRTSVVGELFDNPISKSGRKSRSEEVWESLIKGEIWRSSVYGFPGPDTEVNACTIGANGNTVCAERYLVKTFNWRSVALTKNPINQGIKFPVKITSAKSFAALIKSTILPELNEVPKPFPVSERVFSRADIRKVFELHLAKSCPSTKQGQVINIWSIRDHFIKCDCLTYNLADMYALALKALIDD